MNSIYSAVIIAKNEEATISETIKALLQLTDDIIVILDDRSNDNTYELAINLGAKIYRKSWEGYSINKNYGISKAENDWILCLDADEVLDETLIKNLLILIPDISRVYEMNIQTYFGKYPVKYCGWFPDWNIRLFNKTTMKWNDSFVHEKLVSIQPLKHTRIDGIVKHFSFQNEQHMVLKYEYYAKLRANEWIKSQKNPPIWKRWIGPYFRFFRTYILKLGILDGKFGFIIAKNEYIMKRKELFYWAKMKNQKVL